MEGLPHPVPLRRGRCHADAPRQPLLARAALAARRRGAAQPAAQGRLAGRAHDPLPDQDPG